MTLRHDDSATYNAYAMRAHGASGFLLILVLAATAGSALAQTAPPIDTALACGTPGGAGVTQSGNRLFRVDIPPSDYPNAVCNDGTAGVFYVVASPGGANANRWNIHLQGGGACSSPERCAERWCSFDTNFGMDKMTSTLAPANGAAGNGIFSASPTNPFHDWNHVLVHYCSSDSWSGTGEDVSVTAELPSGLGTVDYSIQFQGASIVDAVIDMLRQPGGAPVQYTDSQFNTVAMPDLDAAELVLLTGASAGGTGVVHNLDRLAAELPATNTNCAPNCDDLVRGVIDASYGPSRIPLDATLTNACIEQGLCTYPGIANALWDDGMVAMWHILGDDSCHAWHLAHAPDQLWRCGDATWLIENHLSTPFFVRFDLQDSLITSNMASEIDPVSGELRGFRYRGMWTDPKLFGALTFEQMLSVRDHWKTAVEGHPQRGAPTGRAPGVFAPQCQQHETLRNNPGFFGASALDENGVRRTMPELLVNWLNDVDPQVAIEPLRGSGALPHCP